MTLYAIVGVGVDLSNIWIHEFIYSGELDFVTSAVLPMIGDLIILYLVMKNLPAFLAEISGAGGFRNYGDAAVAAAFAGAGAMTKAMKGAAMAGVGGAKAAAGTHGAINEGMTSAKDQMKKHADLKNSEEKVQIGDKGVGIILKPLLKVHIKAL